MSYIRSAIGAAPIALSLSGSVCGSLLACSCMKAVTKYRTGFLIAAAAGMMVGCSAILAHETVFRSTLLVAVLATLSGAVMMNLLDRSISSTLDVESFNFSGLSGRSAVRVFIMFVSLFAHSVGEGLSLGMASVDSSSTSSLVSLCLAVHNIPEAAALVFAFRAKGLSYLHSVVLALLSGLPQSIIALLVHEFLGTNFPVEYGMGISAGCMLYAVFFEILPEAQEALGRSRSLTVAAACALVIVVFDSYSHIHIR